MNSLILKTTVQLISFFINLLSLFVLFRGHNEPGGGFVGGLILSSGFTLYAIALGTATAKRMRRLEARHLFALGLFFILSVTALPLIQGQDILTSQWSTLKIPGIGSLGTPLFFDLGVYLIVFSMVTSLVFSLLEGSE